MHRNILMVVLVVAAATGCSGMEAGPGPIPLAGKFADHNETLTGEIRPLRGTGSLTGDPLGITVPAFITLRTKNSKLYCEGVSDVISRGALFANGSYCHAGTTSLVLLRCGNGSRWTVDMRTTTCTTGEATGSDNTGARFSFVYGLSPTEIQQYIASAEAEVAGKPGLGEDARGGGSGTGFLISADGLIVTNHHVIDGANTIEVHQGPVIYRASIIARDAANDLAVLKTEMKGTPLRLASARAIARGDEVLTLGYPLPEEQGEMQKATFGRINATSGFQDDARYLQIDVPIQPGNSGGPLLNKRGEVIGIVSATLTGGDARAVPQNVNYAVKVDYLTPLLPSSAALAISSPQEAELTALVGMVENSVVRIVSKP